MKIIDLGIVSVLLGILLLGGCGKHEKHPMVTLSTSMTPTYNGSATSNVDVVQDLCTAGTNSGLSEYFADHDATATFLISLVSPSLVPQVTVTIDRYSVEYAGLTDSVSAPPLQNASIGSTSVFTLSGSSPATFTETVSLVDLVRKTQYIADINSGAYGPATLLNNYSATYTFEGHDNYGGKFSTSAAVVFEMGNFDNCGK